MPLCGDCVQVAARHGVQYIDVEGMLAKFWNPSDYLVDLIHLAPELNLNLLANMYLNILRTRPQMPRDSPTLRGCTSGAGCRKAPS